MIDLILRHCELDLLKFTSFGPEGLWQLIPGESYTKPVCSVLTATPINK